MTTSTYQAVKDFWFKNALVQAGGTFDADDAVMKYELIAGLVALYTPPVPANGIVSSIIPSASEMVPSIFSTASYAAGTISGVVTNSDGPAGGIAVNVFVDGSGTASATATTGSDGSWSASLSLALGSHTVVVKAADPQTVASGAVTVNPVLATLTLSAATFAHTASAGTTIGAINGKTSGSVLSLSDSHSNAVAISGNNLVVGSSPSSAGSYSITIVETLAGAGGNPKSTTLTITVS